MSLNRITIEWRLFFYWLNETWWRIYEWYVMLNHHPFTFISKLSIILAVVLCFYIEWYYYEGLTLDVNIDEQPIVIFFVNEEQSVVVIIEKIVNKVVRFYNVERIKVIITELSENLRLKFLDSGISFQYSFCSFNRSDFHYGSSFLCFTNKHWPTLQLFFLNCLGAMWLLK